MRLLPTRLLHGVSLQKLKQTKSLTGITLKEVLDVRWLGHACFYLESLRGVRVVTDPFGTAVPYPAVSVVSDVVTVSHEHHDHNDISGLGGSPVVLRGVDSDCGRFRSIRAVVEDVSVRSVASYHDAEKGRKRGLNAMFAIEISGVHLVHAGDLGHIPGHEVLEAARPCDVLFIPVGGHYTVDAAAAAAIALRLGPRVVVPMHYKTSYIESWPIAAVDEFLSELKWKTRKIGREGIALSRDELPAEAEIWVFDVP